MTHQRTHTLKDLADFLSAQFSGDPNIQITGIAPLQEAQAGQISFLDNPKYRKFLPDTQASIVILTPDLQEKCPCAAIITSNPYAAYAKIAALFDNKPPVIPGVHSTAIIGQNTQIDASVFIGPNVVIGNNVHIGKNVAIHAGCTIGDNSHIGDNGLLWAQVTVYHAVKIGQNVIIHSGTVIGSDGFGFAFNQGSWLKIPQIGSVIIGDDVEIGANTTIDRGALGDTIIEKGVKLDNQIQIGHNVRIGAYTIIAGCTAVAGSVTIGKYCRIGGSVSIAGHLTIADQVVLTGTSAVAGSIDTAGTYSSGASVIPYQRWLKNSVRLQNLDELARKVARLEQQLSRMTEDKE